MWNDWAAWEVGMNFSGQCQTVFPSGCVILQSQSQRRSRAAGTFLILPVSRGGATGYPRLRAIGLDGDGLAGAEEPLPSGGDTGAETWGR